MQRSFFGEESFRSQGAVDFIGGNLYIADFVIFRLVGLAGAWFETVFESGVEEHLGAHDIALDEDERIGDGAIYVAFRRQIDDAVDGSEQLAGDQIVNEFFVFDSTDHQLVFGIAVHISQVLPMTGIGLGIEIDDFVGGVGVEQVSDQIASNEAQSAGNEKSHLKILVLRKTLPDRNCVCRCERDLEAAALRAFSPLIFPLKGSLDQPRGDNLRRVAGYFGSELFNLNYFDLAVVADHEAKSLGFVVGTGQLNIDSNQAVGDATMKFHDLAFFTQDAVFNFGMAYPSTVADGGEGTHIAVFQEAVLPDYSRSAHGAVDQFAALADLHAAGNSGTVVQVSVHGYFSHFVEDHAVGFQHVVFLPGVQPPGGENVAIYPVAGGNQLLNSVGNLQFASAAGLDLINGRVNLGIEEIDAHQGQVALGFGRLLFQAVDATVRIEQSNAKRAGVCHFLEKDEGIGATLFEALHQRTYTVLDEVVAQVHDEGRILQERTGRLHRMGQTEGLRLQYVVDFDAPAAAVANAFFYIIAGFGADDDADFFDAGINKRFNAVKQDGFVGHRQKLFGGCMGYGAHSCAFSAA